MDYKWKGFSQEELLKSTYLREKETKCGQVIDFFEDETSFEDYINSSKANYIIIGVQESIGPRANYGKPGAEKAFKSFLSAFLNIQVNRFIDFDTISLGGYFEPMPAPKLNIDELRSNVAVIDYAIGEKIHLIFKAGKTPIVIGGGHNNAYPIIKGFQKAKNKKINVLNIDPHADFRPLEGRHSGNPFSYAYQEGLIENYAVFGLQESYISETMLKNMEQSSGVSWISLERILNETHPFSIFSRYIQQLMGRPTGLEIDMDAITYMPVSAFTPTGFSLEEIRKLLIHAAKHLPITYLHLPEAAPTNEKEDKITGKALTSLVVDFIKSKTN